MGSERRHHPRLDLTGRPAGIKIKNTINEIEIEGDIIDISYTGIRIRLNKPLDAAIEDKIKINLTLPECGTPFTIHGTIKHSPSDRECGIHYTNDHPKGSVDDLMFECIKLTESTLWVKTT